MLVLQVVMGTGGPGGGGGEGGRVGGDGGGNTAKLESVLRMRKKSNIESGRASTHVLIHVQEDTMEGLDALLDTATVSQI